MSVDNESYKELLRLRKMQGYSVFISSNEDGFEYSKESISSISKRLNIPYNRTKYILGKLYLKPRKENYYKGLGFRLPTSN